MKRVLITGANRGIGLQLCKQFLEREDQVIAVCRQSSTALDESGAEVHAGVDVCSDDQVGALATALAGEPIDLLINSAGVLRRSSLDDLDFDAMRLQFEVNSLGPIRVTAALLPLMPEGAKLAIITSRMGSMADNTSGGQYGYRMSKSAVNMAGVSLAHDLKPKKIAVALLHPGFVRTEMTGGNGLIDADESAAGLIARIDELSMENTGGFWHMNGDRLPW